MFEGKEKSQRPSFPSAKLLLFFDMSDHEIVGGCSTLLAKSNKKCIFRDQGLAYIKKSRLKKVQYLQKSRTKKVLK